MQGEVVVYLLVSEQKRKLLIAKTNLGNSSDIGVEGFGTSASKNYFLVELLLKLLEALYLVFTSRYDGSFFFIIFILGINDKIVGILYANDYPVFYLELPKVLFNK